MKAVMDEVYKSAIQSLMGKIVLMRQIMCSDNPKDLAQKKINQFESKIKLLEKKIADS